MRRACLKTIVRAQSFGNGGVTPDVLRLCVLVLQEKQGDDFYDSYKALLRDTGRMTAEDVVQKHLGTR